MAYTTVRMQVYEDRIQAHFEPGGEVHKNAESVGRQAVAAAKANLVPGRGFRTGALQRSVQRYGRGIVSRYGYTVTITATAQHAPWVERGTAGPIFPKRGPWLSVGKREGKFNGGRGVPKRSVAGQRAQHFLRDGMNDALHAHGYSGSIV